jgi:hypothetical protein
MRECIALVSYGVPFDIAFSVPNEIRTGWLIIFGELKGGVFDWGSGQWVERKQ